MNLPSADSESVGAVRKYLRSEIGRVLKELSPEQWQAILVGVSDQGEIAAHPCRLILPFHYPATIDELDAHETGHFDFLDGSWNVCWHPIDEFEAQYGVFAALENSAQSVRVEDLHRRRRFEVLQDACISLDPALTIFGIESDSETWWEVNTFHISGPRIPSPPPPVSDIQILARLCRHTHSYVGKSRFFIEDGVIGEVDFDGACTTDATIDLLRVVPNVKGLLRGLKRLSLESTLVTDRSLKFLKRELPHVEIAYSHFLGD